MRIYTAKELPQRSAQWFAIRRGIPTASEAERIITPKTGVLSAQSEGYINELLAERAGFERDQVEAKWLEHGMVMEGEAVDFFELDTGLHIEGVGFITNDDGSAGCSPDGVIFDAPDDGKMHAMMPANCIGWEGKAPAAWTHFGYLRNGGLPDQYRPQIHFSLAVTGWDRWVFQSYVRGLEPLIVWVSRDEYTEKVEAALAEFLERLETEAAKFGLARAQMQEAA